MFLTIFITLYAAPVIPPELRDDFSELKELPKARTSKSESTSSTEEESSKASTGKLESASSAAEESPKVSTSKLESTISTLEGLSNVSVGNLDSVCCDQIDVSTASRDDIIESYSLLCREVKKVDNGEFFEGKLKENNLSDSDLRPLGIVFEFLTNIDKRANMGESVENYYEEGEPASSFVRSNIFENTSSLLDFWYCDASSQKFPIHQFKTAWITNFDKIFKMMNTSHRIGEVIEADFGCDQDPSSLKVEELAKRVEKLQYAYKAVLAEVDEVMTVTKEYSPLVDTFFKEINKFGNVLTETFKTEKDKTIQEYVKSKAAYDRFMTQENAKNKALFDDLYLDEYRIDNEKLKALDGIRTKHKELQKDLETKACDLAKKWDRSYPVYSNPVK